MSTLHNIEFREYEMHYPTSTSNLASTPEVDGSDDESVISDPPPTTRDPTPLPSTRKPIPSSDKDEETVPPQELARPQRSTAQPTIYRQLANPWGKAPREARNPPTISRKAFSVRALKLNLKSEDPL